MTSDLRRIAEYLSEHGHTAAYPPPSGPGAQDSSPKELAWCSCGLRWLCWDFGHVSRVLAAHLIEVEAREEVSDDQ